MAPRFWMPTFSEAIARANTYFLGAEYADAAFEYELAAMVAPTTRSQTWVLEQAWIARERREGRRSELEAAPPLGSEDSFQ